MEVVEPGAALSNSHLLPFPNAVRSRRRIRLLLSRHGTCFADAAGLSLSDLSIFCSRPARRSPKILRECFRQRVRHALHVWLLHVWKVRQTQHASAQLFGYREKAAGIIHKGRLHMTSFTPPFLGFNS